MTNFTFLQTEWPNIHKSAAKAEGYINADPRSALFYARRTLEEWAAWLYQYDPSFIYPYDDKIFTLLTTASFKQLVPAVVVDKAHLIRKITNKAVHDKQPVSAKDAFLVVKELYHILYWLARTYTGDDPAKIPTAFDETLIPLKSGSGTQRSIKQIQALAAELESRDEHILYLEERMRALEAKLSAAPPPEIVERQQRRQRVAAARAANEAQPISHDYNENETRKYIIDLYLREAGWALADKRDIEYEVVGMPNNQGIGYVDYVLWGDDDRPLGLVEAKRTSKDARVGKQQAKLYADCLETMHGQRPIIFYSNGYETWLWDDQAYPPRPVQGFYTKDELTRLIQRRTLAKDLLPIQPRPEVAGRDYQIRALSALKEHYTDKHRRALFVMATGSGKTRTTIAAVDLLMKANWVKRVLFLADRTALVRQAANAFKRHLPDANVLNILKAEDKLAEGKESRVVVSTYHTMMGLIDDTDTEKDGQKRFSVGHFDLIIIDEAHRSVYQKFGAIFDYFDSLLLGLTATPIDEVDRNTYRLFNLADGVPTFNYELETAIEQRFLVPYVAYDVGLKFPHEGILYDDLSDDEKLEWELIEWDEEGQIPMFIGSGAINTWLFNQDTVDRVLQVLMENGHKVSGGNRLGKTIIFARNQEHAKYIVERFDANYPHYKGEFAVRIDASVNYAQQAIDDFSIKDKSPHIAVSVDMLDTGIDVPEAVNLVFFKPVRSKTKFFQMIGRGTRLCPDLFAPGVDKENFIIFDVCNNFEFFRQTPKGYKSNAAHSLNQQLFTNRLDLLHAIQTRDPEHDLAPELAEALHGYVDEMSFDNFIVRPQRKYVEPFKERTAWDTLSRSAVSELTQYVSGLPSAAWRDDELELRFDNLIAQLQLALIESAPKFNTHKKRVIKFAFQLESNGAPQVKEHLQLLKAIQEDTFWSAISLAQLEDIRLAMRGLIRFIEKGSRSDIYTDFQDEFLGLREVQSAYQAGGVNVELYRKKVEKFVRQHLDHQVIRKIRLAAPLTQADLEQLETFFFEASETGGRDEFISAYGEQALLPIFIRSLVGLDRKAAKDAFAEYLDAKIFTNEQIQFVNYIIEHLTQGGVITAATLFERPYTDIHDMGLDGVFADKLLSDRLLEIIQGLNRRLKAG